MGSDKAYVREAYKYIVATLLYLKNMGYMISNLFEVSDITIQVQCPTRRLNH